MGFNNIIFMEVIEWFDPTGKEMAKRIPDDGSGEIKYGAQLTVRESQVGIFFYNGKAIHIFKAGRHTLKKANIPILNKILSIPWGMTSPLRAEIYFINMKIFTNLKWGTKNPVAFKDSDLGLIRLRAFGFFNVQIVQPLLFINFLVGTVENFATTNIEDYLNSVIVSRFNDFLGETLDTILNLPGLYDTMAKNLQKRLHEDFSHFGLNLTHIFIKSITPPPEVQGAIDDQSKLGILKDLNNLAKMKSAMAIEKAAENPGTAGQGMGMGVGMMMPGMLSQYFQTQNQQKPSPTQKCPDCNSRIPKKAQFCSMCGHQLVVFSQCTSCGKNLSPSAKFCSRCGQKVEKIKPHHKKCSHCGAQVLNEAVFCNQCGEKI